MNGSHHPSCAVAWINGREAMIARTTGDSRTSVVEVHRQAGPESVFLAHVVRAIGDRQRVLILGPSSTRLDLEREYVLVYRRPERLVDVEPAGPITSDDLTPRCCWAGLSGARPAPTPRFRPGPSEPCASTSC